MENPGSPEMQQNNDPTLQGESASAVAEDAKPCPCLERRKKRIRDSLLILGLLLVTGALVLVVFLSRESGAFVEVKHDGVLVATYALHEERTVELNGGTNVLVIEGGVAYLSYANCPDHTCVRTGKIKYNGQSIVCLPNRITVTVVSEDAGGVDFVS